MLNLYDRHSIPYRTHASRNTKKSVYFLLSGFWVFVAQSAVNLHQAAAKAYIQANEKNGRTDNTFFKKVVVRARGRYPNSHWNSHRRFWLHQMRGGVCDFLRWTTTNSRVHRTSSLRLRVLLKSTKTIMNMSHTKYSPQRPKFASAQHL